jgi:S-adenosylmethionine uptake transporter
MLNRLNDTQKGILIAIIGFAAFVGSDSACKWLSGHYGVFQVLLWEFLFCLLFCLLGTRFLGGIQNTLKTKVLKIHLLRAFTSFAMGVTVVYAFQNLPLTSVYPVLFLSPFVMTLMAGYLYGERVTTKDWAVISLGFIGVLIAFRPGIESLDPWLAVAFLCMIFIAIFGLCARALGQRETLLSLAFYPCIVNITLLSPALLMGIPDLDHLLIFAFAGLMLCTGMICIAYAYRIARYAVISPLQYLQLILAFIVGRVVFDETPDIWMIAGSLVIMASGVMLALTHKKS